MRKQNRAYGAWRGNLPLIIKPVFLATNNSVVHRSGRIDENISDFSVTYTIAVSGHVVCGMEVIQLRGERSILYKNVQELSVLS